MEHDAHGLPTFPAWHPLPGKRYRLRDGSVGTEKQALEESIRHLRATIQRYEDHLEELVNRLPLADG